MSNDQREDLYATGNWGKSTIEIVEEQSEQQHRQQRGEEKIDPNLTRPTFLEKMEQESLASGNDYQSELYNSKRYMAVCDALRCMGHVQPTADQVVRIQRFIDDTMLDRGDVSRIRVPPPDTLTKAERLAAFIRTADAWQMDTSYTSSGDSVEFHDPKTMKVWLSYR